MSPVPSTSCSIDDRLRAPSSGSTPSLPRARARETWLNQGVYPDFVPVERVLDVRDRYALNFQSGSYAWSEDELEEIGPNELWPRMWRYCQAVGAPIDV